MSKDLWNLIDRYGPSGSEFLPGDENTYLASTMSNTAEMLGLPTSLSKFMLSIARRKAFVHKFSWAIPSPDAISAIKEFVKTDTVLEIAAGTGLWAKLLQDQGVKVIPTDSFGDRYHKIQPETFTDIKKLKNKTAVKKYRDLCNAIMFCWPPYNHPMAAEALKLFRGNKIIYIGEYNGCTADGEFHQILDSEWKEAGSVNLPLWENLHDRLMFYVKA